jgi:transposase
MGKLLKNFVGIDISKTYFDAALLKVDSNTVAHRQFPQSLQGCLSMAEWLGEQEGLLNDETLFCMEFTGIYNTCLVDYLVKQKALLWVEMALRIKRSSGLERGGNDKTAAIRIAYYAFRYQDRIQLWRPVDSNLEKLKNLIAQRDRIVNVIKQLTVPINELKEIGCMQAGELEKLQKAPLAALQKSKKAIEKLILEIIQQDEELNEKLQLVQSVKGIGTVTAVALLVYTRGLTSFDSAKELACYCGLVPFTKDSGTTIRSKPRVSSFANKKLKKLLHMCALVAIKFNDELKAYYERKVKEGKNKMSVINAIRNKLIHRVFAVVRDKRLFVEKYTRGCA